MLLTLHRKGDTPVSINPEYIISMAPERDISGNVYCTCISLPPNSTIRVTETRASIIKKISNNKEGA